MTSLELFLLQFLFYVNKFYRNKHDLAEIRDFEYDYDENKISFQNTLLF